MVTADRQRTGEALRAARKRLGLTQAEVARLAKVSLGTVRNLEHGIYGKPHQQNYIDVCAVLGVDPDDPSAAVEPDQVRRRMPFEVRTALDVVGAWLSNLPRQRRESEINSLYDRVFDEPVDGDDP